MPGRSSMISLIHRIGRENDPKAFRELFDRHYSALVQYSSYIVGSLPLAEEIVSEVFVHLWKTRCKLTGVKDIKKYLYVAVKNKTIDYIRQSRNLTFISTDKKDLQEYIVYENPEDQCIVNELRSCLEQAVLSLPDKCRMIYRMIKEEHMKYADVAELLDISPKTVENQMIKAMKAIRSEIIRYYKADSFNLFKSSS